MIESGSFQPMLDKFLKFEFEEQLKFILNFQGNILKPDGVPGGVVSMGGKLV